MHPGLSDHRSLLCQMTITAPSKSKRTVTSRNTKAASLPDFQADVKRFVDHYSQCPDRDLADSYSAGLRAVMDRYAPLVTRCVSPVVDWRDQRHAEDDDRHSVTGGQLA